MAANLINLLLLENLIAEDEENENEVINRVMRINRRYLRDHFDPFTISENHFISLYRLNKPAASSLIESLLPHLRPCRRRSSIPPWMRVLTTLDFFASGSYQRRVGQDYLRSMSQTSVSVAVKEVILAINQHLLDPWIKFPNTDVQVQAAKERFMAATNFPGVIGIIDGTQIAIVPPVRAREHLFMNRKGYHSKNVQIICDPDLRILAINAQHGGRSHDSHIWRLSGIRADLAAKYADGRRGCWLLGDSGYGSEPWLLRPFDNHPDADTPEGRYNVRFCSARSTVERCIGVMKAKFRCCRKDRALHYSPEVAGLIINSVAVVHNIGVHYRVPHPEVYFDEDDLPQNNVAVMDAPAAPQPGHLNVFAVGQATRARVVHDHFLQ